MPAEGRLNGLLAVDRTGFSGHLSFGSLPEDPHQWLRDNFNGGDTNPGEGDNLFNNDDGLNGGSVNPASFPRLETTNNETFNSIYARALNVSSQIDAIRGDPFAAALVQKEAGIAQQITDALLDARRSYPWNQMFSRAGTQQTGLWSAFGRLADGLTKYQALQADVDAVKAQIADRQTQQNQAAVQVIQTNISQMQRVQAASIQDVTVFQANTANATAVKARATEQAALATQDSQAIVDRATQPHILGLPLYSTVLPIAGAGLLALAVLHFAKPKAPV